jgi:N-methylhydantoinase A
LTQKAELARHAADGASPTPLTHRSVSFVEQTSPVETPVYDRSDLPAGFSAEGPAVVNQLDSTTVVPPGWAWEVDEWLNIRMHNPEVSR